MSKYLKGKLNNIYSHLPKNEFNRIRCKIKVKGKIIKTSPLRYAIHLDARDAAVYALLADPRHNVNEISSDGKTALDLANEWVTMYTKAVNDRIKIRQRNRTTTAGDYSFKVAVIRAKDSLSNFLERQAALIKNGAKTSAQLRKDSPELFKKGYRPPADEPIDFSRFNIVWHKGDKEGEIDCDNPHSVYAKYICYNCNLINNNRTNTKKVIDKNLNNKNIVPSKIATKK